MLLKKSSLVALGSITLLGIQNASAYERDYRDQRDGRDCRECRDRRESDRHRGERPYYSHARVGDRIIDNKDGHIGTVSKIQEDGLLLITYDIDPSRYYVRSQNQVSVQRRAQQIFVGARVVDLKDGHVGTVSVVLSNDTYLILYDIDLTRYYTRTSSQISVLR